MAGFSNRPAKDTYPKVSTSIRTIKSDVGQVRLSLNNDTVVLGMSPATGKNQKGYIQYSSDITYVNITFGVAAGISELITKTIIPDINAHKQGTYDIHTFHRGTRDAYLKIEVSATGDVMMTGLAVENGVNKTSQYSFPKTKIKINGQENDINGELLALASLLYQISGTSNAPEHQKEYNAEIMKNAMQYSSGNNGQTANFQNKQSGYNNGYSQAPVNTSSLEALPF
jgi:hypothetical protein